MPAGPSRFARRRLTALPAIPDRPSRSRPVFLALRPEVAPEPGGRGRCPTWLARVSCPPNDLASFLEHPAPAVRAAALLSLNVKKALPADLQQSVLDRLGDKEAEVREAAMLAVVPLQLRAGRPSSARPSPAIDASPDRTAAIEALCGIPDPRAVSFYLDRDPGSRPAAPPGRRVGPSGDSRTGARTSSTRPWRRGTLSEPASLTLERVLARFEPIRDWRVIGPFPEGDAAGLCRRAGDRLCPGPRRRSRSIDRVVDAPGRPGDRPCRPERLQERRRRSGRVWLRRATALPTWAPSLTPRSRPIARDPRSC